MQKKHRHLFSINLGKYKNEGFPLNNGTIDFLIHLNKNHMFARLGALEFILLLSV